jgi:hypothetical protein
MSQSELKLLDLAPEVVGHVIKHVDNKKDLANARLTCRALDQHAAKELFHDVFVSMGGKDIHFWNKISEDDALRHMPRHAIIHTQKHIEHYSVWDPHPEKDADDTFIDDDEEDFEEAVSALSRFPNLESVEICFSADCLGEDDSWNEVAEEAWQRKDKLELIFKAINDRDRAASGKSRTIRALTIRNLQNIPVPDFIASEDFRDVMSRLKELHISIIQECNEAGPDHDYTRKELRTFPPHFISCWLKPFAANLKALSIYHATDNWGPFPGYWDFSALSFPKLETLALGYYTLAHDADADWLLAIKSLRKLIMHNCMIASWIKIDEDNLPVWNPPTQDWERLPEPADERESWGEQFAYKGAWSAVFDRLAAELPHLVDLRFDLGSSYEDEDEKGCLYGINQREGTKARVFPQRYVVFDNGILPTHWQEADEEGKLWCWMKDGWPVDIRLLNEESDRRSLEGLLEVVGARARG